jgi:hypothetical protein
MGLIDITPFLQTKLDVDFPTAATIAKAWHICTL